MILFILLVTSCLLGMSLRVSSVFSLVLAIPALACVTILIEVVAIMTGHAGVAWYHLPLAIVAMEGSYVASSLVAELPARSVAARMMGL